MNKFKYQKGGVWSQIDIVLPDATFYENIKGVSLVDSKIQDLSASNIPCPQSFRKNSVLRKSWRIQHGALIEKAFKNDFNELPYRTIFPGPYIPTLNAEMTCIGDSAYSVFTNILNTVKERIPDINKFRKNSPYYVYESTYKPFLRTINAPEEGWYYEKISCPEVAGVSFPMPPLYEFVDKDTQKLNLFLEKLEIKSREFCKKHLGRKTKREKKDIIEMFSFILSSWYLNKQNITAKYYKYVDEILKTFDALDTQPIKPSLFLLEIAHAIAYMLEVGKFEIIAFGNHSNYYVDILKIPLENLIETELCDIQRVLREICTFFSLGWSPIIVHFNKDLGYNIDGTHRHYALLTIELLRRLRKAFGNIPIRQINLNSDQASDVIKTFSKRYNKVGLSFRETLRVVNYIVNSDNPWPYVDDLKDWLDKIIDLEMRYVPVIYLPEWRARAVVKNLCDKGIALIGVPPENIYLVGRSNGKKGIVIRGGYHGTDRQPMFWMNIMDLQKI